MKKKQFFSITIITSIIFLFSSCNMEIARQSTNEFPKYIEIVDGNTTINDSSIFCKLLIKQLPEKLRFNNTSVKSNAKEYEWGVYFDNNNDGNYDLSLSVSNWKSEKEKDGEILKYTQSNIWKIDNEKGANIGDLEAEIVGDTIILTASGIKELNKISTQSKIKYQTYFTNGIEIYTDSLIIENKLGQVVSTN